MRTVLNRQQQVTTANHVMFSISFRQTLRRQVVPTVVTFSRSTFVQLRFDYWPVYSFDPESEVGRKVVKLVIEKMAERAATEASKKNLSDGITPSKVAPRDASADDADPDESLPDTPATQYAKQMPLLPLKMESRASGLLAAWVQAAVILVDALCRAEET